MMWETTLFILAVAAAVKAGGKALSPQESLPFLLQYQQLCGSQTFRLQADNNAFVYCKTWNGTQTPTREIKHVVDIPSRLENADRKQLIFVQPPRARYIHDVSISGQRNQQRQEVYVLPHQVRHQYKVQPPKTNIASEKPILYFLTGDTNHTENTEKPGSSTIDMVTPPGIVPTSPAPFDDHTQSPPQVTPTTPTSSSQRPTTAPPRVSRNPNKPLVIFLTV